MNLLLWYFVFYSFAGFLLEIAFARITDHPKKDRKCFFLLPLCPVYGIGAIFIHWLSGWGDSVLWIMVSGFLGATAAELGMGLFYRYLLGVDFWDYSDQRYTLGGLICLRFSLYWTALALVPVYWVDPFIIPLLESIPPRLSPPMSIVLTVDGLLSAAALRLTRTTDVLRWYK